MPTVLKICFYGGFAPTVLSFVFFTAASRRLSCPFVLRRLRADCLDLSFVFTAAWCRLFVWTAASCRLSFCLDGGFVPTVLLLRRLRADCNCCYCGFAPTVLLSRRLRADCLVLHGGFVPTVLIFARRLPADCHGLRCGGFAPTVLV